MPFRRTHCSLVPLSGEKMSLRLCPQNIMHFLSLRKQLTNQELTYSDCKESLGSDCLMEEDKFFNMCALLYYKMSQ